jgi:allene oxide cyclase-like protein
VTGAQHLRKRLVGVLLAAALVAAGVLAGSTAGAHGERLRTLTLKELEKGATFTHIRNTKPASPRANSQGDVLTFTNPLADASGKVVGTLHAACTTTTGAVNFVRSTITCAGALVLRNGTLTLQVVTSPGAARSTGAVTGGTGAYANARGVIVSTLTRGGSKDTITLAG